MKLIVSREAIRDLRGISRWTQDTFGPRQAKAYIARIEAGCDRLAAGEAVGRPVDGALPDMRKFLAGSHFVYFRIENARLIVVRILHSRMDFQRHL